MKSQTGTPPPTSALSSAQPLPRGPLLLDAGDEPAVGRIDPLWTPEALEDRQAEKFAFPWISTGVAVLFTSWLVLSLVGFVEHEFRQSRDLGIVAVICFSGGLALLLRGLIREWRSYRDLQHVEELRSALRRDDISPSVLHAACRPWLIAIRKRHQNAGTALEKTQTANSAGEIRVILQTYLIRDMQIGARTAGGHAAMQVVGLVAMTPSPAWEGIIVAIRGILLIRQIARIYGIRPGLVVMLTLFRRVAWAAAGVSGLDMLSQSFVDQIVHKTPMLRHVVAAIPGASLAALRMHRLAALTSEACSPLPGFRPNN
jgi:uncharacterized membrane protein YcjF (UPF0283 family)